MTDYILKATFRDIHKFSAGDSYIRTNNGRPFCITRTIGLSISSIWDASRVTTCTEAENFKKFAEDNYGDQCTFTIRALIDL